MSIYLLGLLAIPLGWPFIARAWFGHRINNVELTLNVVVVVAIVCAGYYAGKHSMTRDTEVLNATVSSKERVEVSCSHSYSCRCRQTCTGSGSSRSCYQSCDTCYEHAYDVDWVVRAAAISDSVRIDRIDRRGLSMPARFSATQIGEPYSTTRSFTNYVKAVPDSLFNTLSEKNAYARFAPLLTSVNYPSQVFDYYRLNRAITVGVSVPDLSVWNAELARLLGSLGPTKKSNVVLVFTANKERAFAQALRAHWLGAKPNDTVVVMGVSNYPALDWVDVFAWSDNKLYQVELRDELAKLSTVSASQVSDLIGKHIEKGFKVKSMEDFEYLKSRIEPPLWALVLLFVLGLGASVSLSIFFRNTEHV